jgi:dipeptidase E
MDRRRVVALGGGGFSMEPGNPLLDRFILSLVGTERPRVCFVPTASADSESYVLNFYRAFTALECCPGDLPLFERQIEDMESFVLAQDVIYVGGGNTANLLAVWRVHGLDRVLARAWEEGVVMCGISAGMNCWFEQSVTDSFGRQLQGLNDGLGLLPGSACPHYEGGRATSAVRAAGGGWRATGRLGGRRRSRPGLPGH